MKDIKANVTRDSNHPCCNNFSRVINFSSWRKKLPDQSIICNAIHTTINEDFFIWDGEDGVFGRAIQTRILSSKAGYKREDGDDNQDILKTFTWGWTHEELSWRFCRNRRRHWGSLWSSSFKFDGSSCISWKLTTTAEITVSVVIFQVSSSEVSSDFESKHKEVGKIQRSWQTQRRSRQIQQRQQCQLSLLEVARHDFTLHNFFVEWMFVCDGKKLPSLLQEVSKEKRGRKRRWNRLPWYNGVCLLPTTVGMKVKAGEWREGVKAQNKSQREKNWRKDSRDRVCHMQFSPSMRLLLS